jgi:Spy/CpxP family protein refolding chaperone
MKKLHTILTIITLMTAVSISNLTAQPCMAHASGTGSDTGRAVQRKHRMMADLNLTEEQQNKLKVLHDEMMQIREKHMDAVKTVRDKMKAELLKKSPSQNTLYGYGGELGELHKQMSKDRTDHLLKVKKVLTAEQFSKLVEKEERMGRGGCGAMGPGKCLHDGKCPHKGKGMKNGCCPGMGKGMHKGKCPHMDSTMRKGRCPHMGEGMYKGSGGE